MDWRVKMFGEKVCSILPYGYKLASGARNVLSSAELNHGARIDKGLDNVTMVRSLTGFDCEKKTILELGTGRHGIDCLIFYVLGAEAIYTFDHVLHLEKDVMASGIEPLREKLDDISAVLAVDRSAMAARIDSIVTDRTLEDLLASCNTHYFRYPIDKAQLATRSIDLFYTESVLQRIPVDQLRRILKSVGQLMSDTGVSFHQIDCNDINSQARHYDSGLWRLNYLKYSDFFWKLICAEKFNSQNRLREFEFVDLLEKAGLKTVYVESARNREDVERLRNFPLSKRFREMPLEEVAVTNSRVVSAKSHSSKPVRKIVEDGWTKWYRGQL